VTPEQKCPSARRKVRSLVTGIHSDRLSVSMLGSLSILWTVIHTLLGKDRRVKGGGRRSFDEGRAYPGAPRDGVT